MTILDDRMVMLKSHSPSNTFENTENLSSCCYIDNSTSYSITTSLKTKPRGLDTQCTGPSAWKWELDEISHRAGIWLCNKCRGCLNRRLNKVAFKIKDKLAVRPNIDINKLYLVQIELNDSSLLVPVLHKRIKYLINKDDLDVSLLFRGENDTKSRVMYVTEGNPIEIQEHLFELDGIMVHAHKIEAEDFIMSFQGFISDQPKGSKGTYRFLDKMYKKPPEIVIDDDGEGSKDLKYNPNEVITWVDVIGELGQNEGGVIKNLNKNDCACGVAAEYHNLRRVSMGEFLHATTVLPAYQEEYDSIRKLLAPELEYIQGRLDT